MAVLETEGQASLAEAHWGSRLAFFLGCRRGLGSVQSGTGRPRPARRAADAGLRRHGRAGAASHHEVRIGS